MVKFLQHTEHQFISIWFHYDCSLHQKSSVSSSVIFFPFCSLTTISPKQNKTKNTTFIADFQAKQAYGQEAYSIYYKITQLRQTMYSKHAHSGSTLSSLSVGYWKWGLMPNHILDHLKPSRTKTLPPLFPNITFSFSRTRWAARLEFHDRPGSCDTGSACNYAWKLGWAAQAFPLFHHTKGCYQQEDTLELAAKAFPLFHHTKGCYQHEDTLAGKG